MASLVFFATIASLASSERPEDSGSQSLEDPLRAAAPHTEAINVDTSGFMQMEESSRAARLAFSDNSSDVSTSKRASNCYWLYFTGDIHNQGGCPAWSKVLQEAVTEESERKEMKHFDEITKFLRGSTHEDEMPMAVTGRLWPLVDKAGQYVSGDENSKHWILKRNAGKGFHSNWDAPMFQIEHSGVLYLAVANANRYLQRTRAPTPREDVDLSNNLKAAIEHNGMFRNISAAQRKVIITTTNQPPSWYGDLGRGEADAMRLIDKFDRRSCMQMCIDKSHSCDLDKLQTCVDGADYLKGWLGNLLDKARALLGGRKSEPSLGLLWSSGDSEMIARGKEALRTGRGMDKSIRELTGHVHKNPLPQDITDARLVLTALEAVRSQNVHGKFDRAISDGERAMSAFKRNPDGAGASMSSAMKSLDEAIQISEDNIEGTNTQFYIFMREKYEKAQSVRREIKGKMGVLGVRADLVAAIHAAEKFLRSGGTYRDDLTHKLEAAMNAATPYKDDIHEYKNGQYVLDRMKMFGKLNDGFQELLGKARNCIRDGCDESEVDGLANTFSDLKKEARKSSLDRPLQSMIAEADKLIKKLQEMVRCIKKLQDLVKQGTKAVSASGGSGNEGLGRAIGDALDKCDEFNHIDTNLYAEARRLKKTLMGLRDAKRHLETAIRRGEVAWRAGSDEREPLEMLQKALQDAQDYTAELGSLIKKGQEVQKNLASRQQARLNAMKVVAEGESALKRKSGEEQAYKNLEDAHEECKKFDRGLEKEIQAIEGILSTLRDIAQIKMILRELPKAIHKADSAIRAGSGEDAALLDLLPITFYAGKKPFKNDPDVAKLYKEAKSKLDALSRLSLKNQHKDRLKVATQKAQAVGDDCSLGELIPALEEYQRITNGYELLGTLKKAVKIGGDSDAMTAIQLAENLGNKIEAKGISKRLASKIGQSTEALAAGDEASLSQAFKDLYPQWLQARDIQVQTQNTTKITIPEYTNALGTMKKVLTATLKVKYKYNR